MGSETASQVKGPLSVTAQLKCNAQLKDPEKKAGCLSDNEEWSSWCKLRRAGTNQQPALLSDLPAWGHPSPDVQ